MADVTMCRDAECPAKLKCYRFLALPSDLYQSFFSESPRLPSKGSCDYFLKANCCETSIREWGDGNYTGEETDCMFCNRTHRWTGSRWQGMYP